jgi:conjugal transfer pilus assembly protein TraK
MMQPNIYSKAIKSVFLTSLLCSGSATAEIKPSVIPFEEGSQFNVSLSNINFNRVFVEGEKIIKLSYPERAFTVDKSEMEDPNSTEGSIYLKPTFDVPITLFLTTDKGHHFSLTITPQEAVGKTLKFVTKRQTKLDFVNNNVGDLNQNEEVLAAIKAGEVPHDFHLKRTLSRPFYIKKDIKVILQKQYQGEALTGYVYRLENTSNHEIPLTTALFSNNKAITLSLSDEKIAPKKVAYLYGLYSNEG